MNDLIIKEAGHSSTGASGFWALKPATLQRPTFDFASTSPLYNPLLFLSLRPVPASGILSCLISTTAIYSTERMYDLRFLLSKSGRCLLSCTTNFLSSQCLLFFFFFFKLHGGLFVYTPNRFPLGFSKCSLCMKRIPYLPSIFVYIK